MTTPDALSGKVSGVPSQRLTLAPQQAERWHSVLSPAGHRRKRHGSNTHVRAAI
jgi:hypothetical protein